MAGSSVLCGKTALVTGASRGIGAATMRALASAGATITGVARDEEALSRIVDEIVATGGEARGLAGSVTDARFRARTLASVGTLDILVNNVGVNHREPLGSIVPAHAREILDVNVLSVIEWTNDAVAQMPSQQGSLVIFMSSTQGHRAGPGRAVYAASKHAIEGFMKSVAVELAPRKIRAMSVSPTWVYTEMSASRLSDPEFRSEVEKQIPLGRVLEPTEVADLIVFLASGTSSMLTGSTLHLDGGLTC